MMILIDLQVFWLLIVSLVVITSCEDEPNKSNKHTSRSLSLCGQFKGPLRNNSTRINGGKNAEPGQFPSNVYQLNRNRNCGGVIITDEFILTAAHCVKHNDIVDPASDIKVYTGSQGNSDDGFAYTASKICVSKNYIRYRDPRYGRLSPVNDFAVIKLSSKIWFHDEAQPACLASRPVTESDILYAVGKGDTAPTRWNRPLKVLEMRFDICHGPIADPSIICVHPRHESEEKSGQCKGDSGSGVYIVENNRMHVVGITSFSTCGREREGFAGSADVFNLRQEIQDLVLLAMQAKEELEEYLSDTLVNKLIESKVPELCKQLPCILGIDEAGRGPVLGPMSYAIAYYPKKSEDILGKMKFADSKELTETNREKLFEALQTSDGGFKELGYMIKIISPNMISNSMLRRNKYNLNALSHDTAIDLIRNVMDKKIQIDHVYIDTVGPPIKYKEKLQKFFPGVQFTVTEKADSKYPIVSAASVCAKVMRDRIVKNWRYIEGKDLHLEAYDLGSGYPADPETKKFLEGCVDPVFGFSTLARFSWSTITKALEKNACKCDWNEPDCDEQDQKELNKQAQKFKTFFQKKAPKQEDKASKSVIQTTKSFQKITNADKFFEDRNLRRGIQWA